MQVLDLDALHHGHERCKHGQLQRLIEDSVHGGRDFGRQSLQHIRRVDLLYEVLWEFEAIRR